MPPVLRHDGCVYIPTQQERYSKVANFTLFLCVIIPSAVVYGLCMDGALNLFACLYAVLWPIAWPLERMGFNMTAAVGTSAFVQACAFFALLRARRLTPKTRLTIAVTWGMSFALALRVIVAFDVWLQVTGRK